MKTIGTKLVSFIGILVLVLGCSACNTEDSQEVEEDVALSTAFDELGVADSDISFSSLEPELLEEWKQLYITCSLEVDNPHKSTHVPGTVNVVARVNCSSPVQGIEMTVTLERDGVEVARSPFSRLETAFLKGNAAAPCIDGTYQGTARASVTFPPHILTVWRNREKKSSKITIGC